MAATQTVTGMLKSSRPEPMTIRFLTLLLIVSLPRNHSVTQLQVKKKVSEHATAALSFQLRETENRELISPPPQQTNKQMIKVTLPEERNLSREVALVVSLL